MPRALIAVLTSFTLLAAEGVAPGAAPASPGLRSAGSPQVIPLERFRKALWTVHVAVKGVEGDFLLDTGGGMTLLAKDFAPKVPCTFWGRTTGWNMFGKRGDGPHCDDVAITAGSAALTPVSVGHINFEGWFPGDRAPDGLLSLDAFDGKAITLDQSAATLTIETDSSLAVRTRDMVELPVRLVRDCSARCLNAFVGVPTKLGMTWLILDSGAGGVSLIAKDHAAIFGLDSAAKDQRLRYDVGPGVTVDSPVLVTDMIMDGNLGQPFMSRHVITFDLRHGRLWMSRSAPAH